MDLDSDEPAAGWLQPLPAYERIQGTVQAAGDALIAHKFKVDDRRVAVLVAAAEACIQQLELATEEGTPIATDSIDLWDDTVYSDPPFVLVYLGELPTRVAARNPKRRRGDGGETSI